ncbi:hypothetical protein TSUD_364870 [Trifolium subterraneum]|uniref:Inhibitor I9 domain-containing protein n=1 Tax=Trifolium subterraneum TaxID=3900 RepID=A0A2Z6N971_TRISU|nr:hypothetical protein TSUD_364870 [Trifolium subterraneum]
MGNSSPNKIGLDEQIPESVHLELLSSIIPSEESERIELIHHYNHAFSGFSAMLTENEASALSGHDGVVSVFQDPILELHTTRSWDFLDSDLGMKKTPAAITHQTSSTHDIIIALIDTGIWPESPSFKDDGIGNIPSKWKGGTGINFSNLTSSPLYSLVFGEKVAAKFAPISEARNCYPGSLDYSKVAGKIVVCVDDDPNISRKTKKLVLQDARAMGMIFVSEDNRDVSFDAGAFPFTEIGNLEGHQILQYINSTKKPTATILPTIEVPRYRPAPIVASFSSRATTYNNMKKPVTNSSNYIANPHEMGVGEINPLKALNPESVQKITYKVSFYAKEAHGGYNFGSLTWLDGRHYVHTVYAVKVE